jgi:hypothetical protein
MALAQRVITPSSFSDIEQNKNALTRSAAFLVGDNQSQEYNNIIPFQPIVLQERKLIELNEYKGFNLSEAGEIEVSCYNKEQRIFLHDFKYLSLRRQFHNNFYPEPYLAICFELELEGMGNSKEEALNDLYRILDMYFIQPEGIYKDLTEYTNSITAEINQQNPWKQTFLSIFKYAQKNDMTNNEYQHRIILEK